MAKRIMVVNLADVQPSEPRQELTGEQIERARFVYGQVGYLCCESLPKWVEDFMRDKHPEREIKVWEWIGKQFMARKGRTNPKRYKQLVGKLITKSTFFAPIRLRVAE